MHWHSFEELIVSGELAITPSTPAGTQWWYPPPVQQGGGVFRMEDVSCPSEWTGIMRKAARLIRRVVSSTTAGATKRTAFVSSVAGIAGSLGPATSRDVWVGNFVEALLARACGGSNVVDVAAITPVLLVHFQACLRSPA